MQLLLGAEMCKKPAFGQGQLAGEIANAKAFQPDHAGIRQRTFQNGLSRAVALQHRRNLGRPFVFVKALAAPGSRGNMGGH